MIELIDALPTDAVRPHAAKRGECLFHQGQRTHSLVWVRSGSVHLVRHGRNGGETVIHRAIAGMTVAEAAMFSDFYHCDCVASEDSEVALISIAAIHAKLNTDTKFSTGLLSYFASEIVGLRKRLEIVALPSAKERVLAAVAADMHSGTIRALAAQINLSPEATNRALSQLSEAGALKRVGRGLYEVQGAS